MLAIIVLSLSYLTLGDAQYVSYFNRGPVAHRAPTLLRPAAPLVSHHHQAPLLSSTLQYQSAPLQYQSLMYHPMAYAPAPATYANTPVNYVQSPALGHEYLPRAYQQVPMQGYPAVPPPQAPSPAAPAYQTLQQVQPQQVPYQEVPPQQAQPQQIPPQQVQPRQIQPQHVQPQQLPPQEVQPQQLPPQQVQPQQLPLQQVQPQQLPHQQVPLSPETTHQTSAALMQPQIPQTQSPPQQLQQLQQPQVAQPTRQNEAYRTTYAGAAEEAANRHAVPQQQMGQNYNQASGREVKYTIRNPQDPRGRTQVVEMQIQSDRQMSPAEAEKMMKNVMGSMGMRNARETPTPELKGDVRDNFNSFLREIGFAGGY